MNSKKLVQNIFPLVVLLAVGCGIASLPPLTQGGLSSNIEGASPCPATTWGSSDPIGDEWPMEGGQLNRTGATTTTPVSNQTNDGLVWKSSQISLTGSPVVTGGNVYLSAPVSTNFYVFCLSATTGSVVWQSDIFDFDYFTSPTVAGGSIFVGVKGVGGSSGGWVHCIIAANGDTNWSYNAGDTVDCAPVVAGGSVYFTSRTYISAMGGYYVANLTCLDVTTGNTKWSVATNDSQYTAPTIANGRVYAGNGDNISCYDAVSGVSYWNYTAPVVSPTTVAVAGGYVYFGSGNMIYCVDATNGAFQWGHSTGDTTTAVAVAGGRVYAGSLDHIVYCLDATNLGSQIWAFTTNAEVYSSPVIANGRVYVKNVGDYSKVYCLNAGTGTLNWSYECHTTGGYSMDASPSIANGYLYQSVNGYVYCLPMIFIQPSGTTGTDGVPGYPLWAVVAMGVLAVGVIARKRKIGK